MRKRLVGVIAAAVGLCVALAGCGGSSGSATRTSAVMGGSIGVILPDTKTSARWATADAPFLRSAFDAAGVDYDIENAEGDTARFVQIAEKMITQQNVSILMIVSLDPASGTQVIKLAAAAGIPVIDYDRLTPGGGAKYYVTFDGHQVGDVMGQGVVKGLQAAGKTTGRVIELNGDTVNDYNATLYQEGYDKVVRGSRLTVVDSQPVPGWDNQKAVGVFQQEFSKAGNTIDAVVAANDGLAGAAIKVLGQAGLAGKVLVTGQDATDDGLRRVLLGTQTMTVYKAVPREAAAAAQLAIALSRNDVAKADTLASGTLRDPTSGLYVKSVLLASTAIYRQNVKQVVADGYTSAAKLCNTPELRTACSANGIR